MRLDADRSVSAERPENAPGAFRRVLELDVHGIAFDVHLSREGVPIVIHDTTLDHMRDGHGDVAAYDATDLKEAGCPSRRRNSHTS